MLNLINMDKTEIVELEKTGFDAGAYNLNNNKIYYDQRLNHYPELKEYIIIHEKYHSKYRYNIFRHIFIDIKDTKMWFRKDWMDYYFERDISKTKEEQRVEIYYHCFGILRMVFTMPIALLAFLWYLFRRIANV